MRNALTQALVAGPGRLSMPRGGVGMPQPLPPATRFGALNPSLTTGSRFSGGVVPGSMNMVHPEPPQTFQAPTYAPLGGGMMQPSPLIRALSSGVSSPLGSPIGLTTPPPQSTIGPSTGTRYPAGWWNPETTPVAPWAQPGDPVSTINSPTSGELKTRTPIVQKLGKTYRL
jgi:hypothetical protein